MPKRYQIVRRTGNDNEAFDVVDNQTSFIDDIKGEFPSREAAMAYMKTLPEKKGLTARLLRFAESFFKEAGFQTGPETIARPWGNVPCQCHLGHGDSAPCPDESAIFLTGEELHAGAGRMLCKNCALHCYDTDPAVVDSGMTPMRRESKLREANYTPERLDAFKAAYTPALAAAMAAKPDDYIQIPVEEIIGRMMAAISEKGIRAVNMSTATRRAVTRALGIGNTLSAIDEYLQGLASLGEAKEGLRLQGKEGMVVLNPTKTEDGEFVVRIMVNGKNDENKAYYTNDWDDAVDTAKAMAGQPKESKVGPGKRGKLNEESIWACARSGHGCEVDPTGAIIKVCPKCQAEIERNDSMPPLEGPSSEEDQYYADLNRGYAQDR